MADDVFHPDVSRLVAFLVNDSPLTADEHKHLVHCDECITRMADAATEELQRRRSSDAGS